MVTGDLLDLVLGKRELAGVSREFAAGVLSEWLRKNPSVAQAYERDPVRFTRKKEFQRLRSEVRAELRTVYGVFFGPQYSAKRDAFIRELIERKDTESAERVLSLHRSTAERLPYYEVIYPQLSRMLGSPGSILDLGCGFNPFAYTFLPGRPAYHSADIACADLERVGEYLDALGVDHSERCVDLTDVDAVAKLPRADVAFAFKLFDSLEEMRRNITAELLVALPADMLVVSFPTLSIGQGKAIGQREWFERLVTGKVLDRVTLPNEQFIIVTLRERE